jgi:PAS domain S-box-containing protein
MPMQAAIMLPLGTEASVEYVIVLATARREHAWPETVVTRLRVLGEMLAGALQRQAQIDRFRELEARSESGADLAGLAFYEVNFKAGTAHIDARFCELLGVPPDRQQGLGALEFWTENLHPDDRARVLEIRQNLHDGRLPQVATEYRFLHPTRGEMWVDHLGCVSKRNPGGQALVTFGVLRDITERKRIEEEHRELSQRLIRAHEAERALIARELHDDVSQRLAVLSIDVGRTEFEATDPLQAKAMQGVREGLIRLSEDVHSMAYHLHPSILEELGLAEALHAECERRGRQCEVEISANILSLPDVIAEDVALCLFRVAQEALHNVARHAGARSATVMLQEVDEGLLLAVRDDGVGFDPQHRRTGRHLGLASMRERVHLARGSLDIESTPGHGTAIVAWLPHSRDSR